MVKTGEGKQLLIRHALSHHYLRTCRKSNRSVNHPIMSILDTTCYVHNHHVGQCYEGLAAGIDITAQAENRSVTDLGSKPQLFLQL